MGKSVDEKCRAIHVNLLEVGDYVTKEEIKEEVEKAAGSDRRTVRKYLAELTQQNIIQLQVDSDKFKVKSLDEEIKPEGKTEWIKFKIPTEIKKAIKTFGLDPSALITSTTLDKLNNYRSYTNDILGTTYDESEIKYLWALINHNLNEADDEQNNLRLMLYKQTGNSIDSEEDMKKALVELRKNALDLEYKVSGKSIPGENDE